MYRRKNMRIKIAAVLTFCLSFFSFAKENKLSFINPQFSLGSGYIYYGDSETRDLVSNMNSDDCTRILIGGDIGLNFDISKPVKFVTGTEIMSDMLWKDDNRCFFLDYAFLVGLQFYPGLGGLSAGVHYAVGRRTNIVKYQSDETVTTNTKWGNGYKFNLEYDFKYGQKGMAPILGAYWRHMPRGNSQSDNTISVYFRLLFR